MSFAEDCQKYIQLHAKHARLSARMDVLKERIKPALREGKSSPRDLPYILILQKRLRTLADWKEACKQELIRWFKNEAQAVERVKEIEQSFPTKEDEALRVEINKSFAAKLKA